MLPPIPVIPRVENADLKSMPIINSDSPFSHTFVEKIEKFMNLLPVGKLFHTVALLSHTASSVANAG